MKKILPFILLAIQAYSLYSQDFGSILITCEPGLNVYIDNQFSGITTTEQDGLYIDTVSSGKHLIKIEKQGNKPVLIDLNISPNQIEEITIKDILWDSSNPIFEGLNESTPKTFDSFVDTRDGKSYKSIEIGNQVWMAENLAYRAGAIGYPSYVKKSLDYGYLYTLPYAKEACPPGWHLPSHEEWEAMVLYLGGNKVAGGKLKSIGESHWKNNEGATNESGFSALPGGYRSAHRSYFDVGKRACFWTSGKKGRAEYYWGIYNRHTKTYSYDSETSRGANVRCVKD